MRSDAQSALIFDFDGTLADSMLVSLDILYRLVHHVPLPAEDVSRIRGMTLLEVLRQLRISPWQALLLRGKAYRAMGGRISELTLVPGVKSMLQMLARQHRLYIVSSNSTGNIQVALKQFGVDQLMTSIQGSANPLSKTSALRKLVRMHALRPAETWYIGDQSGDIYAAHRAGLRAAAVSWGFSNLHTLEAARPDLLVFTPEELLQHFNGGTYDA